MRPASIVFVLLLSSASLAAQRATSSIQYIAPPASDSCPVVFSADRLSTPGLSQAEIDLRQKQQSQMQQVMALQQQLAELGVKRSEAASKLAELPPGADPATVLQLSNQIKALDAEVSAKRAELKPLNDALSIDLRNPGDSHSSQSVQIKFKHSPSAIVGVDLTVHGASTAAHFAPAAHSSPASDLSETFHLSGSKAKPLLESELSTQQRMIVTWVELTRIEYASGAVWQRSLASRCAAAPSLFVLVDSGH